MSDRYAHHRDPGGDDGTAPFDELVERAARVLEAAKSPTAIDTYSREKLRQAHDLIGHALDRLHATTDLEP